MAELMPLYAVLRLHNVQINPSSHRSKEFKKKHPEQYQEVYERYQAGDFPVFYIDPQDNLVKDENFPLLETLALIEFDPELWESFKNSDGWESARIWVEYLPRTKEQEIASFIEANLYCVFTAGDGHLSGASRTGASLTRLLIDKGYITL